MLTAMLPPVQDTELEAIMLVRKATYIQASTVRPNTRYFVSWYQHSKLEEKALAMCKRWAATLRQTKQKVVVYCLSKPQCERIAEQLGCAYNHAEVDGRAERLQEWVEQGGMSVASSAA